MKARTLDCTPEARAGYSDMFLLSSFHSGTSFSKTSQCVQPQDDRMTGTVGIPSLTGAGSEPFRFWYDMAL